MEIFFRTKPASRALEVARRSVASAVPAIPASGDGSERGVSDERLIRECLNGSEAAWAALIHRYKNLIYAIPVRAGLRPEDAADIFQAVCLEVFSQLSKLRNVASFRSWLITITANKVSQHRQHQQRSTCDSSLDDPTQSIAPPVVVPACVLEEVERDQLVRGAVASLSPRCRELVRLLFYEQPPRPYREVASALGIAVGSIGFIRGRCLTYLQRALRKAGV